MENHHKNSKESNSFCEKICKAVSNACLSKRTRPVSHQYQKPVFPKTHNHVQTTKQEAEMGQGKIAAKDEPHNRGHNKEYRRSATDLNNRISEYLNRVGKKIRTTSFVGHDHACQVDKVENRSHLDERVTEFIQSAKKRINATSSSVGMAERVSYKSNENFMQRVHIFSQRKMKFGKEYEAQMVAEWQEAYMDYNNLKLIVKNIIGDKDRLRDTSASVTRNTSHAQLKRRASLYRAFSGLTTGHRAASRNSDDEATILCGGGGESSGGPYQTMFLMASEEGCQNEILFFRKLDDEFNKVVEFYKNKVEFVIVEADTLSRQMNALIALRIKVEKPKAVFKEANLMNPAKNPGWTTMDAIPEDSEESFRGGNNGDAKEDCSKSGRKVEGNHSKSSPVDLEILDHVKINVDAETPVSTLKGMLMGSVSDSSFGKEDLRKSEDKIIQAFVEFYRKLRLLKSYSFLNQLAFSKIMKKYDKVTLRNASKTYLEMVDNSYLGSCDEVNRLIERVEATFVKHFTNGNHRKGMNVLRPTRKTERHITTYFLGFLSGCSVALTVAIGMLIHARDIFQSEGRGRYMENIFPLYSLFGFVYLHMIMYAADIYFWNRYRINYSFIFGFKQGTELGYREVLLLSSGLALLTLAGIISNLDMEMNPNTKSFQALTELVPLGLVFIVFLILFCPFNIIYRSNRYFLIRTAFRCLCAPLYKVTLPDFILADQLTSQVQAFRSLEFYVCYYFWGDFKKRSNRCYDSSIFQTIYVIVAIIPYWIRFLQCLRRLLEEKDSSQLSNGLKYFSTIIAVSVRTIYDLKRGTSLLVLAAVSSAFATIYSTYWDIVIDWGLMRPNSKNPWLRDKLLISRKGVYFAAMVLNILLRLAWMQTVLGIREAPFLHRKALVAVVASLEIIRRGIWNFFRLENEHLNNVGNFRAFKSVPLPFNYEDEEQKHK